MTHPPDMHQRRSIRLRDYDYSSAGAYFVTICAFEKECRFGSVVGGEMRLNTAGEIVRDEWLRGATMRTGIDLDAFVVMPNHFHGIVIINDPVGAHCMRPSNKLPPTEPGARSAPLRRASGSLGSIVAGFKSAVTRRWIVLGGAVPLWQRNYHEHIVRDEGDLAAISDYIATNPARWDADELK